MGIATGINAPQQQAGGTISTHNDYFFNGTRVAMRQCTGTCSAASPGTVMWLHSDPLGSATLATDASGNKITGSETRYAPFGSVRFGGTGLPHDRRFNGNPTDIAGLLDFGARAYDPLIGRFVSADTIVPNPADPQALNRYTYGLSNPLRYTDPTGHDAEDALAFLVGVAYGWVKANREAIPIPTSNAERQMMENAESLAVTHPSFTEGRIAGGAIAVVQGVIEAGSGGTAAGGGVVACATGVGCVAGAPVMAVGAVGIYHGAATALSGAGDAAQQLALFAKGDDWSVGEPINKGDPSWETARSRYWQNRAQNAGGEFSKQNTGLMKRGKAPMARIIARLHSTGEEVELLVSKELHHIRGRNISDPHNPDNLLEVWPWEHSAIDAERNQFTNYDFVRFK